MTVRVIVRCVHGLEWLCAEEVATVLPDAARVTISRREVAAELPDAGPALFALRTADDVFLEVGRVTGAGTTKDAVPGLARALAALPWTDRIADVHRVRAVPPDPLLDVVASVEGRRGYNRFAVENALGTLLAPLTGASYLRRTPTGRDGGSPDLPARVFVRGDTAAAALRVGALPLHRRAYKLHTGPGTLHPPVAAALARLTGPVTSVLDPFCGDGTVAIEAALTHPDARVLASDADPERVRNAAANAGQAGVHISPSRSDAGQLRQAVEAIVTNPPWNLAVDARGTLANSGAGSLAPFWRRVPELLAADGRLVALTEADLDVPAALRDLGFALGLATRVRVAGRVAHVVLAAPPGRPAPALPDGMAGWRERVIAAGVTTRSGF